MSTACGGLGDSSFPVRDRAVGCRPGGAEGAGPRLHRALSRGFPGQDRGLGGRGAGERRDRRAAGHEHERGVALAQTVLRGGTGRAQGPPAAGSAVGLFPPWSGPRRSRWPVSCRPGRCPHGRPGPPCRRRRCGLRCRRRRCTLRCSRHRPRSWRRSRERRHRRRHGGPPARRHRWACARAGRDCRAGTRWRSPAS